jgi:hypothetical protein
MGVPVSPFPSYGVGAVSNRFAPGGVGQALKFALVLTGVTGGAEYDLKPIINSSKLKSPQSIIISNVQNKNPVRITTGLGPAVECPPFHQTCQPLILGDTMTFTAFGFGTSTVIITDFPMPFVLVRGGLPELFQGTLTAPGTVALATQAGNGPLVTGISASLAGGVTTVAGTAIFSVGWSTSGPIIQRTLALTTTPLNLYPLVESSGLLAAPPLLVDNLQVSLSLGTAPNFTGAIDYTVFAVDTSQ